MALINCPECSREVSDKAVNCPNCAYPLGLGVSTPSSPSNQIRIKINTHFKSFVDLSMTTVVKVKILDSATNSELWAGTNGQIATFQLEKPTEVIFKTPAALKKLLVVTIDPQKSKTYEFTYVNTWIGGAKYMLNAVDFIV